MKTLQLKHNLVLEGMKIYGRILNVKWNDNEEDCGKGTCIYKKGLSIASHDYPCLYSSSLHVWGRDYNRVSDHLLYIYDTEEEAKKMFDFIMEHTYEHVVEGEDKFFYANEGGVYKMSKGMKANKVRPDMEVITKEQVKWTDSDTSYDVDTICFEDEAYTMEEFEEMLKKGRRELARWKKYLSNKK